MRYWAYIQGMMLGPFSRDQLLSLPGFEPSTPLCPEDRDGEDPADWSRASDVEDFRDAFALSQAPGSLPAAQAVQEASAWVEPELLSPDRLFIQAQQRLEALEDAVNRLEAEKAIKDSVISSLRVELMRLANEARAAKTDLRISEKTVNHQRDQLNYLDDHKARQDMTVRELQDDNARKGRQIQGLNDDLQRLKGNLDRLREGRWDAPEEGEPLSRRERHVAEEVVDWIVSHWKALGGLSDRALRLATDKSLPPDATIAEIEQRIESRAKELAKRKVLARRKALAKAKAERKALERAKAEAEAKARAKAKAEEAEAKAKARREELERKRLAGEGGLSASGAPGDASEAGALALPAGLGDEPSDGLGGLLGEAAEEGLSLGLSGGEEDGLSLGGLGSEEPGGLGLSGGQDEGPGLGLGLGSDEETAQGLGLSEQAREDDEPSAKPAGEPSDELSDAEEARILEEAVEEAAAEIAPADIGAKWLELAGKAPPEPPAQAAAPPAPAPAAATPAPGEKPAAPPAPAAELSQPEAVPPFQEDDAVPAFVPEEPSAEEPVPVFAPAEGAPSATAPAPAGPAPSWRSRWLQTPVLASLALLAVCAGLTVWNVRAMRRSRGAPAPARPVQAGQPAQTSSPKPGPEPCAGMAEPDRARCQQALAAVQFHSGAGGGTLRRELEALSSSLPDGKPSRWEIRRAQSGAYRVDFFAGIPDPATDAELEYSFEVNVDKGEVRGLNLPAQAVLSEK